MRCAVLIALGVAFGAAVMASGAEAFVGLPSTLPVAPAFHPTNVGYYCSDGFAASYGGTCVATPSRDEIDLYLNDAGAAYPEAPPPRRHRRHRGLRERY